MRHGRSSSSLRLVVATTCLLSAGFFTVCAATPSPASSVTSSTSTWVQQTSTGPQARSGASMVFDPTTGDVVLFGGNCSCAPLLDDTWTWNGSTWTDVQPSNSPPGLQNAPFVYDKALGMAVLFDAGGDAWLWSGSNWTEETTNVPLNLSSGASAAYDDTAGDVVAVTGGQTWTWNSGGWTQQHPTSSPSAREFASMAFDESTGTVLLYGGRIPGAPTADQYPGDTWTWNESNWVEDHPASSPPARSNASMSFDLATNSMVLFGGRLCTTSPWAIHGRGTDRAGRIRTLRPRPAVAIRPVWPMTR